MNLELNLKLSQGYRSNSQIARVLTEDWVLHNSYCPNCGNNLLCEFENNRPVADFLCKNCLEEFELKSKSGELTNSIIDGAYSKMINRIDSENNPNFFFLTYSKKWRVENFLIIPKQFFTEDIIIKRSPLKDSARRSGWIGCNINISKVAETGKVFLIRKSQIIPRKTVTEAFKKTLFLREINRESKGWLLDVMKCVDMLNKDIFTLDELYQFEEKLRLKYPNNRFIKDKIRQQLQILRDKEIIVFLERGRYKKMNYENV